ncbi:MAG: hypothetical protein J6A62_08580 [Oscillospiraceae bacterium]|nr:hypothetical protein [Oscillospiraceae bacterium]
MKEIFKSTYQVAVWLYTQVKPACEAVMELEIFRIFAVAASVATICKWLSKKRW